MKSVFGLTFAAIASACIATWAPVVAGPLDDDASPIFGVRIRKDIETGRWSRWRMKPASMNSGACSATTWP